MPAKELHRFGYPAIAASDCNPNRVVNLATGDVERSFIPVATANIEPFGLSLATALQGKALTVMEEGDTIKVTAAASLGAGADVGVATTNGALGPVSAASGSVVWRVGRSVSAAAAGEVFALYIRPRTLSGTP